METSCRTPRGSVIAFRCERGGMKGGLPVSQATPSLRIDAQKTVLVFAHIQVRW